MPNSVFPIFRAIALTVLIAIPHLAAAQATGAVAGSVVDETGGVLPGVTVELHIGDDDAETRLGVTDETGRSSSTRYPLARSTSPSR